ncbi:hypothetical protein [Streptomyces nigrescens]|uniref:hypothetical protein n=1 Tax=Streptomyces nigrescens TaxID=1920 RepID=UPI0036FBAF18
MTTDTPAPADTLAAGPRHLSPRDESRVRLAHTTWYLAKQARALIPVDPEAPNGDLLRSALEVERLARTVVESAVIAERERGTTWEQLAGAAGTTRQSAHERWSLDVQTWARMGRVTDRDRPTSEIVTFLDQCYAEAEPDRPHAVSAGLDAIRHPGSSAYEDAQRTRGKTLHARRAELFRDIQRNNDEGKHLEDASDRDGWLRLAANQTAVGSLHDAMADIYEELLTAEPALADEHRASTEQHRTFASGARDYADLALKEAGKL